MGTGQLSFLRDTGKDELKHLVTVQAEVSARKQYEGLTTPRETGSLGVGKTETALYMYSGASCTALQVTENH